MRNRSTHRPEAATRALLRSPTPRRGRASLTRRAPAPPAQPPARKTPARGRIRPGPYPSGSSADSTASRSRCSGSSRIARLRSLTFSKRTGSAFLRPSQPRHPLPSLPPRATRTQSTRLERCQRLGPRSCSASTAASSFSRTSAGRLSHLSSMAPPSEPAVSTSRLPIPSRRPKRVCLSVKS